MLAVHRQLKNAADWASGESIKQPQVSNGWIHLELSASNKTAAELQMAQKWKSDLKNLRSPLYPQGFGESWSVREFILFPVHYLERAM